MTTVGVYDWEKDFSICTVVEHSPALEGPSFKGQKGKSVSIPLVAIKHDKRGTRPT